MRTIRQLQAAKRAALAQKKKTKIPLVITPSSNQCSRTELSVSSGQSQSPVKDASNFLRLVLEERHRILDLAADADTCHEEMYEKLCDETLNQLRLASGKGRLFVLRKLNHFEEMCRRTLSIILPLTQNVKRRKTKKAYEKCSRDDSGYERLSFQLSTISIPDIPTVHQLCNEWDILQKQICEIDEMFMSIDFKRRQDIERTCNRRRAKKTPRPIKYSSTDDYDYDHFGTQPKKGSKSQKATKSKKTSKNIKNNKNINDRKKDDDYYENDESNEDISYPYERNDVKRRLIEILGNRESKINLRQETFVKAGTPSRKNLCSPVRCSGGYDDDIDEIYDTAAAAYAIVNKRKRESKDYDTKKLSDKNQNRQYHNLREKRTTNIDKKQSSSLLKRLPKNNKHNTIKNKNNTNNSNRKNITNKYNNNVKMNYLNSNNNNNINNFINNIPKCHASKELIEIWRRPTKHTRKNQTDQERHEPVNEAQDSNCSHKKGKPTTVTNDTTKLNQDTNPGPKTKVKTKLMQHLERQKKMFMLSRLNDRLNPNETLDYSFNDYTIPKTPTPLFTDNSTSNYSIANANLVRPASKSKSKLKLRIPTSKIKMKPVATQKQPVVASTKNKKLPPLNIFAASNTEVSKDISNLPNVHIIYPSKPARDLIMPKLIPKSPLKTEICTPNTNLMQDSIKKHHDNKTTNPLLSKPTHRHKLSVAPKDISKNNNGIINGNYAGNNVKINSNSVNRSNVHHSKNNSKDANHNIMKTTPHVHKDLRNARNAEMSNSPYKSIDATISANRTYIRSGIFKHTTTRPFNAILNRLGNVPNLGLLDRTEHKLPKNFHLK